MKLGDVVNGIDLQRPLSAYEETIEIQGLSGDSRNIKPGWLFCALSGSRQDGKQYIRQAVQNGACCVIADTADDAGAIVIPVKNSRYAYMIACDNFFHHPSQELTVIGVTGTNGKSTITHIIYTLLTRCGYSAGLIGTVYNVLGSKKIVSSMTTPPTEELFAFLREMCDNRTRYVAMEVSSHALDQQRIGSLLFDVGIFSNLALDHLDYHKTKEQYAAAKRSLFTLLECTQAKQPVAILNTDDVWGAQVYQELRCSKMSYGTGDGCTVQGQIHENSRQGLIFQVRYDGASYIVHSPLKGVYNMMKWVAVVSGCVAIGIAPKMIVDALASIEGLDGRMDYIPWHGPFDIVIDYAHTEDGLLKVLEAVRPLTQGRVIVVFGCGGNRDTSKRPLMGAVCSRLADWSIITSDNPRTEDPEQIIAQIEQGMTRQNYEKIIDRRQAIEHALSIAQKNDTILIAGKGHESQQIYAQTSVHFNDKEVVRELLGIE